MNDIKNIKFAEELKIVVYNFLYNIINYYKNPVDKEKFKILYIDNLKQVENELKKIFNTNDLDEFKEKKNMEFIKDFPEKIEKYSIRDLLINFGNNIVRNKNLTNELIKNEIDINKNNNHSLGFITKMRLSNKLLSYFIPIVDESPETFSIIDNNNKEVVYFKMNNNYIPVEDTRTIFSYIFADVLEKFTIKNLKEILTAKDIWTAIALKKISSNKLNIITDGRFLTEIEEINNSKLNNLNILLIKVNEKGELDSSEVNKKNFSEIYKVYKKAKTIEEFLEKIKGKVTGAEELNTLLTIHYFLKNKYKNKKFLKKTNDKLDKEIEKKTEIDLVLFNEIGNNNLLNSNINEIINNLKNKDLVVFIANRRSGKDFYLKKLYERIVELNNENKFSNFLIPQ